MVDFANTPLDFSDRGTNATHFGRQAEVIFLKKVRTTPEPGYGGPAPSGIFDKKFFEFKKNGILRENVAFEQRDNYLFAVAFGPTAGIPPPPIYEYWQITTSNVGASSNVNGTNMLLPNTDVMEVHVNQTVRGMGSASIVLKNALNKYVFQNHPMFIGQPVFESDDMVFINLPGLDGNLYRAFTGLVTTVSINASAQNYQNTITIECDDMLKRLRENRVAARPSLNIAEARTAFQSLSIAYADKLPHEVLTSIFARAYCDFYTIPGFAEALAQARELDPASGAQQEEDLLQKLSALPADNSTVAPGQFPPLNSSSFLLRLGEITTGSPVLPSGAVEGPATASGLLPTEQKVPSSVPRQVFGYRNAKVSINTLQANPVDAAGIQISPLKGTPPVDTLAFVIEGTIQPSWQYSFFSASMSTFAISEWQSAFEVAQRAAEEVEFELYTTPEGVVRFRPFNTLLPADIFSGETTSKVRSDQLGRVGSEYWLQQKLITTENFSDTDKDVFTIAYVVGDPFTMSNLNTSQYQQLQPGIATDSGKFVRLGARVAPQKTKTGLVDPSSCQSYAVAYLSRLNARARSGHVEYTGDARIRAGNPCFVPHRNRIYYIESLSHSYVAGQSFKTSLSLTYGRVPFALTPEKAQQLALTIANPTVKSNLISYYTFEATLSRLRQMEALGDNPLFKGSGQTSGSISESDRYIKYGPSSTNVPFASTPFAATPSTGISALGLNSPLSVLSPGSFGSGTTNVGGNGMLVFQGYVWEDIPVMTFEDLLTDVSISGPALNLAAVVSDARLSSRSHLEYVKTILQQTSSASIAQASAIVVTQRGAPNNGAAA